MDNVNQRHRIFVVDDHPLIRKCLSDFIDQTHDLEICGAAASGDEALQMITCDRCDLVLVDVSMPGMNGIELVARLREKHAGLLCLMLSGHSEQVYVRDSLEAGARGYVTKGDPGALLHAIRKVLGGEMYMNEAFGAQLRAGVRPDNTGNPSSA